VTHFAGARTAKYDERAAVFHQDFLKNPTFSFQAAG
jgi:hypothetical protein